MWLTFVVLEVYSVFICSCKRDCGTRGIMLYIGNKSTFKVILVSFCIVPFLKSELT